MSRASTVVSATASRRGWVLEAFRLQPDTHCGGEKLKVVGIISGTSCDAIETAAAELHLESGTLVMRPLGARAFDFDVELREAVIATLPPAATSVEDVVKLDTRLGQAFASAATEAVDGFCGGR